MISDCITVLNYLARRGTAESDAKKGKYGIELGLDPSSPEGLAYLADVNKADQVLAAFLRTLSDDTLQRLQALMYSGRQGDTSAPANKAEFLARNQTKEEIVRTICEKRPALDAYFTTALQRAKAEGFDIENF